MYQVDNRILGVEEHLPWHHDEDNEFLHGLRRLTNSRALSVRVAASAVSHFQVGGYTPANLAAFGTETNGFENILEHVVALPEAGVDLSDLGRLRRRDQYGGRSADALGQGDDDPFGAADVGHLPDAFVLTDAADQAVAVGGAWSTAAWRSSTSKQTLRRPSSFDGAVGEPGRESGRTNLASSSQVPPRAP